MVAPDIAKILIDEGIVTKVGKDVFIANEPAAGAGIPDNTITIYDTGSDGEENSKFALDNLNFQVRVRDKHYINALTKSETIKRTLQGIDKTEVYGNDIIGIYSVSGITLLEIDDRNRGIAVANYRALKQIKNSVELGNRNML